MEAREGQFVCLSIATVASTDCAAYCALVMAFASMSMEQAIAKWFKTRAYYAPFQDREYMIEALLELQEELHTYRR